MRNKASVALLIKVANEGAPVKFVDELGIKRFWYVEEELKLFDYMVKWVRDVGTVPSLDHLSKKFTLPDCNIEEGFTDLIHVSNTDYVEEQLFLNTNKLTDKMLGHESSLMEYRKSVTEMLTLIDDNLKNNALIDAHLAVANAMEDYKARMLAPNKFGIPYGLPYFDYDGKGINEGDYISIAGRPGSGKTYLLLHMANSAFNAGYNVLWVGTEMSDEDYLHRLIALRCCLNANDFYTFSLSSHIGMKKIEEDMLVLQKGHPHISGNGTRNFFKFVSSSMAHSMDHITSAVRESKPDMVYIDGMYLLRPPSVMSRYEQVSYGAEEFKRLAQEIPCAIAATYQLQRKAKGTDVAEIYMSDVVGQLSSVVINLIDDIGDITDKDESFFYRTLNVSKGRKGETGKVVLEFNLESTRIRQTGESESKNE